MTLRVWLNRTFATNYHVVNMLKVNPDGVEVYVLASHIDMSSPVLVVADETFPERVDLTGDEYAAHAVQFCLENHVDVFIPTWEQEAVARNLGWFNAHGIAVLTSPADTINLFEDKARTYEAAHALGVPVPDYRVVTTSDGFVDAYSDLKDAGHEQVCFKPVRGVGAEGFRLVSNGPRTFESLVRKAGDHISYAEAVALLEQVEAFPPLMVMPVLSGGEVSVDTLAHDGTILLAVPRHKKSGTRVVELLDAPELVAETAKFVSTYNLAYLSNVQFRFDTAGNHYLLEVNTRASGGLFQSCLSAGNMPWYSLQVALEGKLDFPEPKFPVRLTTLSTAVAVP